MNPKKRAIIRGMWGIYSADPTYQRRNKIDDDIKLIGYNPHVNPFSVYVFGKENYEALCRIGYSCKMIDERPSLWEKQELYPNKRDGIYIYIHKLKIIEAALNDFDEVLFVDWDCMEAKELPSNFWETLANKSPIQAHLRGYRKKPCVWRKEGQRVRPCASFVYVQGQQTIKDIMSVWEKNKSLTDEQLLAKYTDEISGGWKGIDYYWDHFEPDFFALERRELPSNTYSQERIQSKNITFLHINRRLRDAVLELAQKAQDINEKRAVVGSFLNNWLRSFNNHYSTK